MGSGIRPDTRFAVVSAPSTTTSRQPSQPILSSAGQDGIVGQGRCRLPIDLVSGLKDDLISWSFYGESGGPCTWDGGAELGWCGSSLWAFNRWGDVEPDILVLPAPPTDELALTLVNWVLTLDWELPYLLSAVGMPAYWKKNEGNCGKFKTLRGKRFPPI